MSTPRDLRVIVIGAGMAGILSVIRLREIGLPDLTVYEKADRLGGTWRENRYPGVACDVPSHLYSYTFAPNPEWTHRFSPGPEIQEYLETVATEYDVERDVRYGEEVTELSWMEGRWHLRTASGIIDEADVVIAATGVLHHPSYPVIDGLDDFAGITMHTARWDDGLSLAGRRVGIIGTGSSAIQTLPTIVDEVASVSLFQRTAQWVMPADNPAYTEDEKAAFRDDPGLLHTLHEEISELFSNGFSNAIVDADSEGMRMIEAACLANLEDSVADPELRERLRPDYRAGCKRLVISPTFYDGIQHPNAELVTEDIERIEPGGVRTADGRLHELDVLVLATGFRVDRFLRPIEVIGVDGLTLDEAWAKRPNAYLSISTPGFPNLFMLNGPNGPVGNFSLIEVAEVQFNYISQLMDLLRDGRAGSVCVTGSATEEFEEERTIQAGNTVWATGCNSWYLDDRGVPMAWPWNFQEYRNRLARPDLAHYNLYQLA
jgi:cation diffusion facilitator CzcD-associated flavoprotein CzcO